MSKKIGILTFHRAFSYGAVLQAYALQNFLFQNNIDNEIVDYHCDYMITNYQKIFRKTKENDWKNVIWRILKADDIIKSRKTYPAFVEKYLKLSRPYDSKNIGDAKENYSKFIVGSDQVWSPICVGFDPVYFLNFADSNQKYSYSASIAKSEIPGHLEEEYRKRLSDFQSFSLRENSGKQIVENLLNRQAQVHTDPTFLLKKADWDIIADEKKEKEPYILLFTVLKPKNLVKYALELSKKTGLKVIYLNNQNLKKEKGITYIDPVSPNEFISLIKNAEFFCTNSFHGTAFSLLYEKAFITETDNLVLNNIRSQELMIHLGLEGRILADNSPDINQKSDWERVRKYLAEEREKSKSYLLSI